MSLRPNRRDFLKLLSSGVIGLELDLDRLLWVPGKKTIFLPSNSLTNYNSILALEMERLAPYIGLLFQRDDIFYTTIKKKEPTLVSSGEIRIPLSLEPKKK